MASAVAGWPLAAFAQNASPVVGFLNGASYELSRYLVDAFHRGRRETGYVEGKNVSFDYRSASQSAKLGELTRRHALPAVYQYREFTAAGGFLSYAGSIRDAYRVAGVYTGRILKGEKPANLPVQQSVKAELFVNLSTAKALGMKVPHSVLVRADEVLE